MCVPSVLYLVFIPAVLLRSKYMQINVLCLLNRRQYPAPASRHPSSWLPEEGLSCVTLLSPSLPPVMRLPGLSRLHCGLFRARSCALLAPLFCVQFCSSNLRQKFDKTFSKNSVLTDRAGHTRRLHNKFLSINCLYFTLLVPS